MNLDVTAITLIMLAVVVIIIAVTLVATAIADEDEMREKHKARSCPMRGDFAHDQLQECQVCFDSRFCEHGFYSIGVECPQCEAANDQAN